MVDSLSTGERSLLMGRIRSSDTKPELIVRRLAHACGYRFRLGGRRLPGRPDLVFPGRQAVIFVHGCFWHRHACSRGQSVPGTRTDFWLDKFEQNRLRDQRVRRQLTRMGWRSLVVWECQTKDIEKLEARLRRYLG